MVVVGAILAPTTTINHSTRLVYSYGVVPPVVPPVLGRPPVDGVGTAGAELGRLGGMLLLSVSIVWSAGVTCDPGKARCWSSQMVSASSCTLLSVVASTVYAGLTLRICTIRGAPFSIKMGLISFSLRERSKIQLSTTTLVFAASV